MEPFKSPQDTLILAGLNLIQQGISLFDQDLKLVMFNQPMMQMFNLTPEIARPGNSFGDVIRYLAAQGEYGDVGDLDEFVAARVQLAREFQPHYMERTRANGRTISVEGTPLPQGGWVTVYTDITRLKQNDLMLRARSKELSGLVLERSEELAKTNRELEATIAALQETQRQLTEIEARTRLTTEMMPAHIAHVDLNEVYTYSNRRLSSVLPERPGNVVGMSFLQALGPAVYQRIKPRLDEAMAGQATVFEFSDEDSARRIRLALTPDRDETGAVRGVYVLSMDITEEAQTRAALQQARRREMGAQLTSGLAHDFSNLLTIILGMQAQLQRMDLPAGAPPLIEGTLAAARRGGALLGRIADITAPRQLRPMPVDMARLVQDLQVMASPSLPSGITLRLDMLTDAGPYLLDAGMVQDSLLNLILNARDACGDTGEIAVAVASVRDTWLEFTVSDTGPGFSETALNKALDPFFSTKGGEGSGLGLAMVYDMTKLLGGQIRLTNSAKGAEVRIRLPLRRAERRQAPGLVLLVEDSADLRQTIRDMLTGAGHTVIEAASVPEARLLLAQLPDIQLVLSDISLEGAETGLDLVRGLAPEGPPAYLMTSLPASDPRHLQAQTLSPVLAKPFSREQLLAFLS
jgi:signal transduction histidine kinase